MLLLEAGGADTSPLIHIPAAVGRAMVHPDLDWGIEGEPDPSRQGRREIYRAGKTLGGSSSINGLFFSRGQREDFDDWAGLGNSGWSYDDVLPFFRRIETAEMGEDAWRGRDGPLNVSRLRSIHALSPVFLEAAVACGIPRTEDYNGALQRGASLAQVSQYRGRRHSAARAYLHPVRGRSNLEVRPRARCHRLLIENGRCVGVEYEVGGRIERARATSEVLLAAGALGSPKLLMLSGIGPGAALARLGIPVHADLPGVGRNLQEHPDVTLSAHVNVDTYNLIARNPLRIAGALARWAWNGTGSATSPYCQAVAFLRSDGGSGRPDLEILFAPFSFARAADRTSAHVRPAVNVIVSLCRPSARGELSLRSARPEDPPCISLALLADEDLPTLVRGCRVARDILTSAPFAPYVVEERLPGSAVSSDAEWIRFLRETAFAGNHLVGTCRMGVDDDAVVTPRLEVRGIAGLRVIDASVMPRLISAHTNAVVFMIAERACDWILR